MRNKHPLIRYLERIASEEQRSPGALAVLRRGLALPPGTDAAVFPHVVPYLTENEQRYLFAEFCLTASLFGLHPHCTDEGNMGSHMRLAAGESTDATERRFTALLRAHREDLHHHLRQAVSFLGSKHVPVNWARLCWDILDWSHMNGRVQKAWARGFWGSYPTQDEEKNQNEE